MTIKQTLKNPAVLILLLLLPVCTILLKGSTEKEEANITALYYIEDDSSDTKELARSFKNYNGLFRFERAESIKELETLVKKGEYECGYIITSDIYDEFLDRNYAGLVKVIASERSTMIPILNETMYSIIFPIAERNAVTEYLTTNKYSREAVANSSYDEDVIKDLYDVYYTNGSVFHFEYKNEPEDYMRTKNTIVLSPLRGILAIIILLSGIAGAFSFYKDSTNPVFKVPKVRFVFIAVPVIFAGISALLSVLLAGIYTDIITELTAMCLYCFVCIMYCFILSLFIKKGALYAGLLPFILIGCIAFTPVILDICFYIPSLKPLCYIWPSHYYLMFF